jgi:hypothetical protein
MKTKIAKSLVKIGENVTTVSYIGLLLTSDQVSALNALLALTAGIITLILGYALEHKRR